MMLKDKVAVIYGAGGAIGSAVARAFAGEGATLFLTGRHLEPERVDGRELAEAAREPADADDRRAGVVAHTAVASASRVDSMSAERCSLKRTCAPSSSESAFITAAVPGVRSRRTSMRA